MRKRQFVFLSIIALLNICVIAEAKNIAYIYGDVSSDGDIPSGSEDTYDQMLITDDGSTGLSEFKDMIESEGHTITQYYDESTTINAAFLSQFDVVIFGLHQRVLTTAEKSALDTWIRAGGGVWFYSDSAAGGCYCETDTQNSVGQNAVNGFISAYGMEVCVDQANGVKAFRAGSDATHSIVEGRPVFEGEGVSPVAVDLSSGAQVLIPYIDDDEYKVSGDPDINYTQNITIEDPSWAALALRVLDEGNIIVSFDRQPMWNDGPGSDINERDNLEILRRIVNFLAGDEDETENENLALSGTASQSSTGYNGDASRAIDGNTSGVWKDGSVTHTNTEADAWWQVDLGTDKTIGDIILYNRTDACCTARLSNFTVYVINSDGSTTFSESYTTYPDPSITLDAGNVQGQIIKIQLDDTNPLSLAEVQVFEGEESSVKIEAEDYNSMSGIQTETTTDTDGGINVGWINDGDWCKYSSIDLTGVASIDARIACDYTRGDIEIRLDGSEGTLIGTIEVENTDGNQSWQTNSDDIISTSGTHDVYLVFTGGSGYLFNINWFILNDESSTKSVAEKEVIEVAEAVKVFPNPVKNELSIVNNKGAELEVYNNIGKLVLSSKLISNNQYIDVSNLTSGIYFVKMTNEGVVTNTRIIKK